MRSGISIFALALCAWFAVSLPCAAQTNAVPDDPDFVLDLGPKGAGTTAGPGVAVKAGPSYNCRYAKLPAEVAICDSPELSELDRTMSIIYFS